MNHLSNHFDEWGQAGSNPESCRVAKFLLGVIYNSEVTCPHNGIIIVIDHMITWREQRKVVS